jgi:hypothetical protein
MLPLIAVLLWAVVVPPLKLPAPSTRYPQVLTAIVEGDAHVPLVAGIVLDPAVNALAAVLSASSKV